MDNKLFNPKSLNKLLIDQATRDARDRFPQESCGIIASDHYVPLKNISATPEENFEFNYQDIQQYIMDGSIKAVIHSHTFKEPLNKTSCPSVEDMKSQIALDLPWGIIDIDKENARPPYWWGDFILNEDLLGKPFHHGIHDCYSLIRKYYYQKKGVRLPDYARAEIWWAEDNNPDFYRTQFDKIGFTRISREELQDGDVVIGKVNSKFLNHGGIYLNNHIDGHGLILHHLVNRLSRRESINPYLGFAELFLRYKKL